MPFRQSFPRPLTFAGIAAYAPYAAGVYGLANASEWILIDGTNNLHDSLNDFLRRPARSVIRRNPTGFVYELSGPEGWTARRDRLIYEYRPTC